MITTLAIISIIMLACVFACYWYGQEAWTLGYKSWSISFFFLGLVSFFMSLSSVMLIAHA